MLYSGEQILSFKSCLVFYAGDSLKNVPISESSAEMTHDKNTTKFHVNSKQGNSLNYSCNLQSCAHNSAAKEYTCKNSDQTSGSESNLYSEITTQTNLKSPKTQVPEKSKTQSYENCKTQVSEKTNLQMHDNSKKPRARKPKNANEWKLEPSKWKTAKAWLVIRPSGV